jgi:signal transduction histidine kinase
MRRVSASGRWSFTLRAHLFALVLGTLLPALVLASVLVTRVVNDNRRAVQQRMLEAARAQAAIIDSEFTGTIRALQALAESERLSRGELEQFYAEAARLQRSQLSWFMVLLHAPDGRNLLSTARPYGTGLTVLADPESLDTVFRTAKPVIGTLRPGADGRLAFPIRVPVERGGRVLYVLSAVLTPTSMNRLVAQQRVLAEEYLRAITDANGVVVARSRESERYVGHSGPANFLARIPNQSEAVYAETALDGTRVYAAFARSPFSGWIAAVTVRVDAIDAAFRQTLFAIGAFGLLLLGLGGGGAFLISRRISRDIASAARSASAIAVGDRPELPQSEVAEVEQLVEALARSAALLDIRQSERDEHVARADAARAEAEAADRAKDEFLAMLAHELRNPLAPVLTALQLMRIRGDDSGLREREIIERQVRHLVRLVDDLLDVSRVRRGRIELRSEPFEIRRAIDKAIEISTSFIANRGHKLIVDVAASGLGVDGDETRLAQVFVNLLNNAAKYADKPGQITLTAAHDASSDMVVVSCHDEGIGIEPALVSRVFDLFTQGGQTLDRASGGLGLGLAVARTLVELHGGMIEAHSEGRGRGSTFVVKLPRVDVPLSDSGPVDVMTPVSLRHLRVLVVDDNQDAAEMLAEMLRASGCVVKVEFDGFEALKTMERFHADACVLDIGLPTMDGFELARRLRAIDPGRSIRLIAVTGYGQEADVAASLAAGFDRHLVKPVSAEALLEAIRPGSLV